MKLKKIKLVPLFLLSTTILSAQIEQSKLFIEALSKGDDATAYHLFDTVISNKLPQNQLNVIWSGLQSQAGKFKGYLPARLEENIVYTPCEFEYISLDLKLVFNNQKKITGFYFVPAKSAASYQKPPYDVGATYTAKDVFVTTKNFSLPGILTLPAGKTNVPLIILVHGSGPGDKDETIGPNKIFKDLAVGLASNGVATLRYDKRTKVYPSSMNPDSITIYEETIDDAASAINLASSFSEIDPAGIFVLGHSMGGMLAPKIAKENPSVKGIILLAANARPLQDLILEQTNYILTADELTEKEQQQLMELEKQVIVSKSKTLSIKTPSNHLPMNIPAMYWMSLNSYQPLQTAAELTQKIFVLQGERDYQVTMEDFNLWKKQLGRKAGFKAYPKLNHLFIEGEGKSLPKEYDKPGNVAPELITDIVEWINRQ